MNAPSRLGPSRLLSLSRAGGSAHLGIGVPTWRSLITGLALMAIALLVVAPALLSTFELNRLGKYVCFAIVAVGIGFAWGRGGMLTLGQGVFFGLGGYAMAMHMQLADAEFAGAAAPEFMMLYGSGQVPIWWEPFRSPVFTVVAVVALPALLALLLGYSVFRRKVKGAYFAILSQALVAAFGVLLIGNQATTGGFNGLSNFQSWFGYVLADPTNKRMIYFIAAAFLLAMIFITFLLMRSRFGELLVATRDAEERVRFLGYNPATVKVSAFVVAAVMAGIAGALFVPIVGIISPADIGVTPSIVFLIGVAAGGRASLFGPAVGAIAVAWAETSLSESFPDVWNYFQGLLLVLVIALLPGGVASLAVKLRKRKNTETSPTGRHGNDADAEAEASAGSSAPEGAAR